jgi:hypothetical protein
MTTVALPPVPRTVPDLVVDPGGIRGYGSHLLAGSAQIDDLGTFVGGPARITGWEGQAATAYAAAIQPIGYRADAMSLALRGVSQRVDVHADTMERLVERRIDLETTHAGTSLTPWGSSGARSLGSPRRTCPSSRRAATSSPVRSAGSPAT